MSRSVEAKEMHVMFTSFARLGLGPLVALALLTGCQPDAADAPAQADGAQETSGKLLSVEIVGAGTAASQTSDVDVTCTREEDGSQSGPCAAHTTLDDVKLSATPANGWRFDHWEIARGIENSYVRSPQGATLELTGVGQVSATYVRAVFVRVDGMHVSAVMPFSALPGGTISIDGTSLGGANAQVTVNGASTTVLPDSTDTELHVVLGPNAITGPIEVTNGSQRVQATPRYLVGLDRANWKVSRPANAPCFDVASAYVLPKQGHDPMSIVAPTATDDPDGAGFTLVIAINTVDDDPAGNMYFPMHGTWYPGANRFEATLDNTQFVGTMNGNALVYTASGTFAPDGTGSGTIAVHLIQNGYTCDASGSFTINR